MPTIRGGFSTVTAIFPARIFKILCGFFRPEFFYRRATRPGMRSACLWSRIASATGWTNFPVAWAMPTGSMVRSARRPDDGVGAPQVEIIGHSERISEPCRLCRPRRSAARLQAGFRRSIGGLHWQATDRLIEVRPGFEVVIRRPLQKWPIFWQIREVTRFSANAQLKTEGCLPRDWRWAVGPRKRTSGPLRPG